VEAMSNDEKSSLTFFQHKNLRDMPSSNQFICNDSQIDEFNEDMALVKSVSRDRNRILINCIHGHSRSASVVI